MAGLLAGSSVRIKHPYRVEPADQAVLVRQPVEPVLAEPVRTEETVEMVPEERQIPLSQRVSDLVITEVADLTAITVRPWAKSMC